MVRTLKPTIATLGTGKPKPGERIRGRKGQELRQGRLAAEPLCRDCKAEGKVTLATGPDHIIPRAQGGQDKDENIRCLCDRHHAIRTASSSGKGNGS